MKRPVRAVFDTNVIMSALLWRGRPGVLLDLAGDGSIALYSSEALLAELARSLRKPRLAEILQASAHTVEEHVFNIRELATIIEPADLNQSYSRDPDDDRVIACAVAAGAQAIITGDQDLLVLGSVLDISIYPVADFLNALAPRP